MKIPILISTAAYDGYDLATAFKEISRAGVDLVEIAFIEGYTDPFTEDYFNDDNAAKIKSLLAQHNLKCLSFSAHLDLSRDGIVAVFNNRMAFAAKLGSKYIVTNAAPLQKKNRFMQNIRELGQTAAGLEMVIVLENPGDGKANVVDSGAPCMAHPPVRLHRCQLGAYPEHSKTEIPVVKASVAKAQTSGGV